MKTHTLLLIIVMSFSFYNFQCNDCETEIIDQSSYSADINPINTELQVNDTLLLSANFSSMIPLTGGSTYDNANKSISFNIQIFEVKPANLLIVDGIEDFDINGRSGIITRSSVLTDKLTFKVENTCDNMTCEFIVEFIPKVEGVYCINLTNGHFGEYECESLDLLRNTFNLGNNNFKVVDDLNTTNFRVLNGGVYYSDPENVMSFYFFKVNE
jgi:hypothetical protein